MNLKKEKIKSENKSELRNVKNRNSYDEKFRFNGHMKIKNIKMHSYELNK